MSANTQTTRKPFPVELFAQFEIDEDDYIFQGNKLIGELVFPFIQEVCEIDSDKVEKLLKEGIKIDGYEGYTLNKQGIPVQPMDYPGYPEGELTRDVFFLYYYKNVCIGRHGHHEIEELDEGYMSRLQELGVEYSFKWGISE